MVVGLGRAAHADAKGDIEKKLKEAMESYDGMDYDAAKKLLGQALTAAKKGKLDKDAVTAKAYLDLGIVAFVNGDADGAKASFVAAVKVQPRIQIDPAYKSPELTKLLDEARLQAKGGGSGGGDSEIKANGSAGDSDLSGFTEPAASSGGGGDCSGKGLQHELIDTAKAGSALKVEASLGSDVKATKVSVMFRPEGSTSFVEVKMTKQDGCKYVGTIPASGMRGSLVHYYVQATGANGKPVAAKGSAGSPNIMELTGGSGGGAIAKAGDDEDPLGGKKKADKPKKEEKKEEVKVAAATDDSSAGDGDKSSELKDSGEVSATGSAGKPSKLSIGVSLGTGFSYLASQDLTEASNSIQNGGLGWGAVVITPELMYKINDNITISAVARIGLPVNANVPDHASVGPAGLLRGRYALDPSGEGFRVLGELGYGLLRNTVTLSNGSSGMNTDIATLGPLLIGAGAEWAKKLNDRAMFIAGATLLGGFAVGVSTNDKGNSSLTGAPLNNGVGADLSVGVTYGL
jgi:hypothetical protein